MLTQTINEVAISEIEDYCSDNQLGGFRQSDTCVFFDDGQVILCMTGTIGENAVEIDLTIEWQDSQWQVTEFICHTVTKGVCV
jgi:hypothetical protein